MRPNLPSGKSLSTNTIRKQMKVYQLAATLAYSDSSRSAQWSYAAWSDQRSLKHTLLYLILLSEP